MSNLDTRIIKLEARGEGPRRIVVAWQQDDENLFKLQDTGEVVTADELAATLNTINYEIVTSITARVPRVYLE